MAFRIVRNDITKMNTEAVVNTASGSVDVGPGCDCAIYEAAGYDELLKYRKEKIGPMREGDVFITPGFGLNAKYIIHAVSPLYRDGDNGEEEKLRSCYRKSLLLAKENGITSIAFPLISSGGFGYPKEEAMRIAADEINEFLLKYEMEIILVVFDSDSTDLGGKLFPELEAYIDNNYVRKAHDREYDRAITTYGGRNGSRPRFAREKSAPVAFPLFAQSCRQKEAPALRPDYDSNEMAECAASMEKSECWDDDAIIDLDNKLHERLQHKSDTFAEYFLYLLESKGLDNVAVYKKAIVDKKYFSKLKNNRDFHPDKLKALCLCVGAELNIDETRDLLARAGYALSPSDMTDIIFSFYIEHKHFDVIDIDIKLEEYGLPCVIS